MTLFSERTERGQKQNKTIVFLVWTA